MPYDELPDVMPDHAGMVFFALVALIVGVAVVLLERSDTRGPVNPHPLGDPRPVRQGGVATAAAGDAAGIPQSAMPVPETQLAIPAAALGSARMSPPATTVGVGWTGKTSPAATSPPTASSAVPTTP